MDRQLDPHLQRIIDSATGANNNDGQGLGFSYPQGQRSSRWMHAPELRRPAQQSTTFNEYNQSQFDASSHTHPDPATSFNRISLPRTMHSHSDTEPRVISNADNHFKFTQNPRERMPNNPIYKMPSNRHQYEAVDPQKKTLFSQQQMSSQHIDPIDNLANAMLASQPVPRAQELESVNFFQAQHQSRINQLQPQKQQITPPFNLSGFVYSPSTQVPAGSSSPTATHGSSPTTRVSIRRSANLPAQHPSYSQVEDDNENEFIVESPQQENYAIAKRSPQMLALGHAPPMAHGIQLISPHELPDRFRQVFPYELFNAAQSKCFTAIYRTNDNVVVSAPTGSGKTALLELAICKVVESYGSGLFKIVYQAPTKSLCAERMRDWQKKFAHLNLQCAELTGDTTQAEMARVRAASIIVTTPEKWDSITRKWADHAKLVQMVKLFLIDEVHILKDARGATLEAVVSRMKTAGANVRFVALSATVPNSEDIATWLGRDHTNGHIPAHRETFGEDFRPVKLQKHVYGYDGMMNDFAFDKVLDGKLPNLIQKHTHKKPIMVFCFTRKSVESTATMLAEWWTRQRVVDRAWPAPTQRTVVGSKELQQLVTCGVAFHHAGLDPQDRHAIETAYLKGDISLICCTSTLAMGVNLPCHLVFLKGTVGFQDGHLVEYSDLEVMQMLGRAGRPQFDDSAVAVIMTRSDKMDRYKKMISGQDVLESTLHLNLIEHLNSEISLGSVKDLYSAKEWIKGTFFNVRMRQNPNYYKISGITAGGDTDQRLELVCERDIKLLQENNLVRDAERFGCTEYGEAMSRYMIQFDTMKLLLSIPPRAKTEQILTILCQATEFKDLRIKPQERPFLREFNKSPFIKYPIKETVSTTAHKVSLMIQIQLGGIEHPADKEFAVVRRQFTTDKSIIFERIQRLIRCVIDCKAFDCDAISTRHALDLARSLSAEFWENSNLQLRQIPQVGPAAVRKFVSSDVNSIEKLMAMGTADIERIMSKNPPYGKKTKDLLQGFPRLSMKSEIAGRAHSKLGQKPKVSVKSMLWYENEKIPVWNIRKPSLTFMAETTDGTLVHFWRGNISKLEKGCEIKFNVELSGPEEEIRCWIACEEIVGTMRYNVLKHDIPASAFPAPASRPMANTSTQISNSRQSQKISMVEVDEFGGDELEDDDMLAVMESVEPTVMKSIEPTESGFDSDDFEDIDDVQASKGANSKQPRKIETFVPSVQMANGKWTCSHACANNKVLKNGQLCKHRCCHEGLDKPRKEKNKPRNNAGVGSQSNDAGTKGISSMAPRPKVMKVSAKGKMKLKEDDFYDEEDAIVVDLAQGVEPTSYADLAPREYRKLHKLHTSVQADKSLRLPKHSEYSYASGNKPDLGFLHKDEELTDMLDALSADDDDEKEFPSPSALKPTTAFARDFGPDPYGDLELPAHKPARSSFPDDSLMSQNVGMNEYRERSMARQLSPKVDSSFANGVFDFDAFDDVVEEAPVKDDFSPSNQDFLQMDENSTPATGGLLKRQASTSPEDIEVKHRRITKDEPQSQATQAPVPDWVNEFDSDLINELRDYVDFIE